MLSTATLAAVHSRALPFSDLANLGEKPYQGSAGRPLSKIWREGITLYVTDFSS